MKTGATISKGRRLGGVFLVLLLAAAVSSIRPWSCFAAPDILRGVVTYVDDGDTLWIRSGVGKEFKIRLYGIDAPEVRHREKPGQPFGRKASKALISKVRGENVSVEVRDTDRYGRLVGVVRLDGRDINLEMIREGWAWAYRNYLKRPYASEYIDAEKEARAGKLGLWKQANPQPPWEFRRSLR